MPFQDSVLRWQYDAPDDCREVLVVVESGGLKTKIVGLATYCRRYPPFWQWLSGEPCGDVKAWAEIPVVEEAR